MFTEFITKEEDHILRLRFQPMTLEEVAAITGYSRQRVRVTEARAMLTLNRNGFGLDRVVDHYNPEMAERRRLEALRTLQAYISRK